jgi:hypothetical protein
VIFDDLSVEFSALSTPGWLGWLCASSGIVSDLCVE